MPPPFLVIAVGNPSRGDDALGPRFIDRLATLLANHPTRHEIELLTDFQLQIEHTLDLQSRQRVLFVDASLTAPPPFTLTRLTPIPSPSPHTHALTPAALLEVYQRVLGPPPDSWQLAIRGDHFALGDPLSPSAQSNLDSALTHILTHTPSPSPRALPTPTAHVAHRIK